ncbi:GntR family transcriptional regulator [Agromyces sp. SYSU K20354]|uniref:GntR family transcriptional regulator n=1 Tax=Agromyces cavernae TaxID=2898659 RepID=UPI001E305E89|nr:GntR family transcriptional regulator [Agromyces cavernae]MCD2440777.1 GntR family transcriptional regulator [Agromyces cavernae]
MITISLSGSAAPTDQIRDQIRGLVASGRLAADERLPSVRQLAKDLGVAPGTVAKAYKALEAEGCLTARAGGTRVSKNATTTPRPVLEAARRLAETSARAGTGLDDTIRVLRAIWPEQRITADTAKPNRT